MIKKKLANLIDLKTIITLLMVGALIFLMFIPVNIDGDIKTLFCTSFGMVITYYFTRQGKKDSDDI